MAVLPYSGSGMVIGGLGGAGPVTIGARPAPAHIAVNLAFQSLAPLPIQTNLQVKKGTTKTWSFAATNALRAPLTLADAVLTFEIRNQPSDPAPMMTKDNQSAGGVAVTDFANGLGTITLSAGDSVPWTANISLYYQFKITQSDGSSWVLAQGTLLVTP